MFKFFSLSLATATLLAGTAAIAQPASGQPVPDRSLTRADAEARAVQAFERFDVNRDGVLSPEDREAQARARFDAVDADGNGQLSFAETTAARESRKGARAERRAERPQARGTMMAMRPMAGMRGAMRGMMADGPVSQADFTAAALARFDAADANRDGTITADERRSQRAERRGAPRGAPRAPAE